MWGMIVRISLVPGKRDDMVALLKQSAAKMPGCLNYVVAKDETEENTLWVTEVWESQADHDASLSLRQVQDAIPRARSLIAKFEKIAVTTPLWGEGTLSSLASQSDGTIG